LKFLDRTNDDDAVMEEDPVPVTLHFSCTANPLHGFLLGCLVGVMASVLLLVGGAAIMVLAGH
jgi:hypothetical protein